MNAEKNEHGVYAVQERLCLMPTTKGWRGCALAEIELALTPEGWRSAHGYNFSDRGGGGPIMDCDQPFQNKADAIAHEIERLRARVQNYPNKEVPAVMRWLDSLQPTQQDLFA